jgi:hypothetical protein
MKKLLVMLFLCGIQNVFSAAPFSPLPLETLRSAVLTTVQEQEQAFNKLLTTTEWLNPTKSFNGELEGRLASLNERRKILFTDLGLIDQFNRFCNFSLKAHEELLELVRNKEDDDYENYLNDLAADYIARQIEEELDRRLKEFKIQQEEIKDREIFVSCNEAQKRITRGQQSCSIQ